MRKIFLGYMLLSVFFSSLGTARADSDEHRRGYWDHSSKHDRDRDHGWHEGRRDGGHHHGRGGWGGWGGGEGDGDGAGDGDEEPVDQAAGGHLGEDD